MKYIAHRGNVQDPNPSWENSPAYVLAALSEGYDAEIDLWLVAGQWMLGHDAPQYKTDFEFLKRPGLWIHCKHYDSLQALIPFGDTLNFFYHTDEDYVLTSQGWIWAYPGQPGGKHTICVMPEWNHYDITGFAGVCSDHVWEYK